jgi:hypothetical protein
MYIVNGLLLGYVTWLRLITFEGKVCSGDFVNEFNNTHLVYLWQVGMLYKFYIVAAWLQMLLSALLVLSYKCAKEKRD